MLYTYSDVYSIKLSSQWLIYSYHSIPIPTQYLAISYLTSNTFFNLIILMYGFYSLIQYLIAIHISLPVSMCGSGVILKTKLA